MDGTELRAFFVAIIIPFFFFSPFKKKRRRIKGERAVMATKNTRSSVSSWSLILARRAGRAFNRQILNE